MISKLLHLNGLRRRWNLFLVNKVLVGVKHFERKRKLLNSIGYKIGENTKIVGPILCQGTVTVGKDTWIGKNFRVNGNGNVTIGDSCDIGPEVSFNTGGHEIGDSSRRAGPGKITNIEVGNGTWICTRSTIVNDVKIGNGCVIAACACVVSDVDDNVIVGGVPAKTIRKLNDVI